MARLSFLRPLVITGPSGVGKGTILDRFKKEFPMAKYAVAHTTRSMRPGEEDGVNYHFVSKEVFQNKVEHGEMLEYAQVHVNFYGRTFTDVEKVINSGNLCILELDVKGAKTLKTTKLNPNFLFIKPLNMEVLRERLESRNTETPEIRAVRLETAREEMKHVMEHSDFWDAIIVNDELEKAYSDFINKIFEWYPELAETRVVSKPGC